MQLTYDLLQYPHTRISRVLEVVTDTPGALQRRVSFEYDSPGFAHFFPALIVPLGRLIDTIHIEAEERVHQLTLIKDESMSLSYLLLKAEVARAQPRPSAKAGQGDGTMKERPDPQTRASTASDALDYDRFLLPLVPEIARQSREDLAGLYSALRRLRLLTQVGAETPETLSRTAALVGNDTTWRLWRTLMAYRVVYVPVGSNTRDADPETPRIVRQKVTVAYEHDTSMALGSPRSKVRTLLGHQLDDYVIHAHAIGRSRSYHFRMRGRQDDFVRRVDVLTPRVGYYIDDWERPQFKELGPLTAAEMRQVRRPDRVVDNLVHVHVTGDDVPINAFGEAKRYYFHAQFRERPVGHLGITMVRLLVAIAITVGIGVAAPDLVGSSHAATLPLSVFFAVPTLVGLTQGFKASSYVVCNVATYGTVLLSILCGMLYIKWAVAQAMPASWWWSRATYLSAVVVMGIWLVWVIGLLLRSLVTYNRRKRAI